jgi:hypothetical protein
MTVSKIYSVVKRLAVNGKRLRGFTFYLLLSIFFMGCSSPLVVVDERLEEARIFPDYQGELVIPPNIAPLNFEILEPGKCFAVQIGTYKFRIKKSKIKNPLVKFPQKTWRKILSQHIGDTLEIRVFSGDSYKCMIGYKPFRWIVSPDSIDSYVVFRHIAMVGAPGTTPQPIGIYEQNLETFGLRTLTETKLVDNACMNCHHFSANRSSRMCVHFRRTIAGTLITSPDSTIMVDISLPNGEKGVFGAFSPNERFLAFSTNQLTCIHEMKIRRLKTWSYDTEANLFVYDVQNNAVYSSDDLMAEGFQKTYPAWSHDGNYLYFCQSNRLPKLSDDTSSLFNRIQNTHYALVKVAFDGETGTFGTVETVVSSEMIGGRSVSFPACSPDGNFIVFSTTAFGTLDPLSTDGRLWFYDINAKTLKEVEPEIEIPIVSSSGWSSDSRWIVVASRRMDGLYSRPFFVHVDSFGNTSKPFVMPQKNPNVYRKQDYSYSLPELIFQPVPMHAYDISCAVRKPVKQPNYLYNFDKLQPATPSMGKHTE